MTIVWSAFAAGVVTAVVGAMSIYQIQKQKRERVIITKALLLGLEMEYTSCRKYDWDEGWLCEYNDHTMISDTQVGLALMFLREKGVEL